ncbi:MAG: hypothetical protein OHK0022_47610 [Roseiflexaceae bacterium]
MKISSGASNSSGSSTRASSRTPRMVVCVMVLPEASSAWVPGTDFPPGILPGAARAVNRRNTRTQRANACRSYWAAVRACV